MDKKEYIERLRIWLKIRVLLGELTSKEMSRVLSLEATRWDTTFLQRRDKEQKVTGKFFTVAPEGWGKAQFEDMMADIAVTEDENGNFVEVDWDTNYLALKSEVNVRLGLGLNAEERKYKSLDEFETLYKEQQKETTLKAKVGEIETKGAQGKYWETVMPMLNARISSGQISYPDVQKLIKDTNELIALGVDPRALPEYSQAQIYQRQIKSQAETMGETAGELDKAIRMREEAFGQKVQSFLTSGQTDVAMREMERARQITRQPRNWIEYWQMQHGVNPGEQPLSKAQKWESYLGQQNETLANLEAWNETIERNPPMVKGSAYWDLKEALPTMLQAQRELVAQITQSAMPPASETSFWEVPPATPMAESWLERLVPGQKTGQPLTKPSRVPTPSGQQWQNLLPSEREKFAGYLDWANVDVDDILFQMQRSLPETPAGAGRWNPVRQRSG